MTWTLYCAINIIFFLSENYAVTLLHGITLCLKYLINIQNSCTTKYTVKFASNCAIIHYTVKYLEL